MPYFARKQSSSAFGNFESGAQIPVYTGIISDKVKCPYGQVPEAILHNWVASGSVEYIPPELLPEDDDTDYPNAEGDNPPDHRTGWTGEDTGLPKPDDEDLDEDKEVIPTPEGTQSAGLDPKATVIPNTSVSKPVQPAVPSAKRRIPPGKRN